MLNGELKILVSHHRSVDDELIHMIFYLFIYFYFRLDQSDRDTA